MLHGAEPVYDIEVEGEHAYLASAAGVELHNCPPGQGKIGTTRHVELEPAPNGSVAQIGDRVLVQSYTKGSHTVGLCGENLLQVPETDGDGARPEVVVSGGLLWLLDGDRVGVWPPDGSADVSWVAEDVTPIGPADGYGFVVMSRSTLSAELVDAGGARSPLFGEPVTIEGAFRTDDRELQIHYPRFQTTGSIVGLLDDDSVLRVADVADPSDVRIYDGIKAFALGPGGNSVVVHEGTVRVGNPNIGSESWATLLYFAGEDAPVDLGRGYAHPWYVLGPYVTQLRDDGTETFMDIAPKVRGYYDTTTRTEIEGPPDWVPPRIYRDGTFVSVWDSAYWSPGGASRSFGVTGEFTLAPDPAIGEDISTGLVDGDLGPVTVVDIATETTWALPDHARRPWVLPGGAALFVDADTDLSVDGGFEVWLARRDSDDEPVLVDEAIGVGRHQVRVGVLDDTDDVILQVLDPERPGLWRYGLP